MWNRAPLGHAGTQTLHLQYGYKNPITWNISPSYCPRIFYPIRQFSRILVAMEVEVPKCAALKCIPLMESLKSLALIVNVFWQRMLVCKSGAFWGQHTNTPVPWGCRKWEIAGKNTSLCPNLLRFSEDVEIQFPSTSKMIIVTYPDAGYLEAWEHFAIPLFFN